MSKIDEEILLHKESKRFLDMLSIAAGQKAPVNQKKRRKEKERQKLLKAALKKE